MSRAEWYHNEGMALTVTEATFQEEITQNGKAGVNAAGASTESRHAVAQGRLSIFMAYAEKKKVEEPKTPASARSCEPHALYECLVCRSAPAAQYEENSPGGMPASAQRPGCGDRRDYRQCRATEFAG